MEQISRKRREENVYISVMANIILPVVVLTQFNIVAGPMGAFAVALTFPIVYGLYSFIYLGGVTLLGAVGFVSIVLTGVIGSLQLPPEWILWKETGIPLLCAFAVLVATPLGFSTVKLLLYREPIFDLPRITEVLKQKGAFELFVRDLKYANYGIAGAFLLSAFLNYTLVRWILESPPGTVAFNTELARIQILSLPVIAVPVICVFIGISFYLVWRIKKLSGLEITQMLKN